MLSSARFAAFARVQIRPVLALLVPAGAALTLVLAAEPASAGAAPVLADDAPVAATTAQTTDGDNGFSWG